MNRLHHLRGERQQIQAVARGELKVAATIIQWWNQRDLHCHLDHLDTLDLKRSMSFMHEIMMKLHSNPATLLW